MSTTQLLQYVTVCLMLLTWYDLRKTTGGVTCRPPLVKQLQPFVFFSFKAKMCCLSGKGVVQKQRKIISLNKIALATQEVLVEEKVEGNLIPAVCSCTNYRSPVCRHQSWNGGRGCAESDALSITFSQCCKLFWEFVVNTQQRHQKLEISRNYTFFKMNTIVFLFFVFFTVNSVVNIFYLDFPLL